MSGGERFRLSIDFTDRRALLDFLELLRRSEFLPRDVEARRRRPGIIEDAATEEYVVSLR